jgi:competence protein ComEC
MSAQQTPARPGPAPGPLGWLAWRPLLLVCSGLIVGIALADHLPHTFWSAAAAGLCGLAAGLGAWRTRGRPADALLIFAALCAGATSHDARMIRRADDLSRYAPARIVSVTLEVVAVMPAAKGVNALCRARMLDLGHGFRQEVSGLVHVRSRETKLRVGQQAVAEGGVLRPWRVPTNPYQRARGPDWARHGVWCYLRPESVRVVAAAPRVALSDMAARWRSVLTRRLELAMLGPDSQMYAHLVGAITYGASLEDVPRDLVDLYRRTGTIHVLVVSGAQVTCIVVVLLALTGRVSLGRRPARPSQLILVLAATFAYAILCGRQPSILRAAAMAVVMALGLFGGRRYDLPTAIALVGAILLLAEPADLFTPGLQLTFAAVIGMVAAMKLLGDLRDWPAPRLETTSAAVRKRGMGAWAARYWPRVVRGVTYAVVGTAGAWSMSAPIVAAHFGGLALTANIANAAVVPIADLTLLVGLVGTGLALVHPLTAMLPMMACRGLLVGAEHINEFCSRLPLAYIDRVQMSAGVIAAWYVAVVAAYALMRYGGRWQKIIAGTAGAAALLTLLAVAATPPAARTPTVTWLDVGEGLCTVVETPGRHFMLFDAGSHDPDFGLYQAARDVILPYLAGRGCRRLDAVVISHPDADHYNAAEDVMAEIPAAMLIVGPYGESRGMKRLLVHVERAGVPVRTAQAGAEMQVGPVAVRFLHPQREAIEGGGSFTNNNCLVAAVDADGCRAMLTGDIEREGQEELARSWPPAALGCTALQVPHHGRASAYDRAFLELAAPKVAVTPCGPKYLGGNLDAEFGAEFEHLGTAFLTTAAWGAVTVEMRPEGMRWRTFLREPLVDRGEAASERRWRGTGKSGGA